MLDRLMAHGVRILRWSERYAKTDMVYLASGSFWLSGSGVITAGVSFGLALAFANLLPKEAYGTYKYVLTIFGILGVTCLRSMDTAVTQAAARGKDGTVVSGLYSKMRWGLWGSIGALGCAFYYYVYGGNTPLALSLVVAAVFVPLMEPFGIFNAVLVGKKDFKLSSILGSAGQLVAAVAIVVALMITKNPILIFAIYCAIWTTTRFFSYIYTLEKYPPNDQHEPNALSFALHSSVISAMSIIIGSIDSILIFHYLGAAELAMYSFATAPVSHIRTIINTPTTLATPKLAALTNSAIKKILFDRTWALFLVGSAIAAGYCVLAYPFFHIFFPQYIDVVPYSLLFSLTIVIQVTNTIIAAAVNSRATLIPKKLLYLWNIPSVVIAISSIGLIPFMGLWGALIGQILSYASSSAITWFMWHSITRQELAE